MSPPHTVREIAPEEVQARLERGDALQLIDVREPSEFAGGRIPGARLLPLGELPGRHAAEINADAEVVCLCAHGVRSKNAARFLAGQGYAHVASMAGGMAAYGGEVEVG